MAERTARVNAVTPTRHSGGHFDITGGCDTDKEIVVVAVYNAIEETIETREFSQTNSGKEKAAAWLQAAQVQKVVIESTANYHVLFYEHFRKVGLPISVINPMLVKSLLRVEGKSDKGDAMTLARLAAAFELRTSNMPDLQQKELRLQFRTLDKYKRDRISITNQMLAQLTGMGVTVFKTVGMATLSGQNMLLAMIQGKMPVEVAECYLRPQKRAELIDCLPPDPLPEWFRTWLAQRCKDVGELNQRIETIETDLRNIARTDVSLRPLIANMLTVPGITELLAVRIIAECGSNFYHRYPNAAAFAKAIGIVPSNEVSGGKLLKRKASHGNMSVKKALLAQAKGFALHLDVTRCECWCTWFVGYKKRAGWMKATSALARKMAEAVYIVSLKGEPFRQKRKYRLVDPSTGEVMIEAAEANRILAQNALAQAGEGFELEVVE
jgi:transposase